jgi:dihydroneopterin aldolase
MGIIEIEGMHFYAFHGHFEAEQIVGSKFRVDIKIKTGCTKAAETDNLDDALNYQNVYEIIHQEMGTKSKLLENIAKRILDALYSKFSEIKKVRLKISKLNPPMGGEIEKVSVTLTR